MLCGWASIDERGKISGGRAGDQTGREVKLGPWYYFKQTVCLRFKDRDIAQRYADALRSLCNNKHIGYDQNQRTSLYNELKRLKWDYKKLTKDVECDCSELVACCVCCAVKMAIVPSYIYTGNLVSILMNTGYFKKLTGSKYCKQSEYLMIGDILNASGHHVISVLENGSKAGKKTNSKIAEYPLYKGCTGSEVKKLQSNLCELGFKVECDGRFGTKTKDAVKAAQRKFKLEADGYYGTKTYEKFCEKLKRK